MTATTLPTAPQPRAFADELAALLSDLGGLADSLAVDVVGLSPGHIEPDRLLSRATVTVLVTAREPAEPGPAVEALLALQARARHDVAEVTDWSAFGRTPQAGFLVRLPAELALERPVVPIVRHPLEARPFDRTHRDRPDAPGRP